MKPAKRILTLAVLISLMATGACGDETGETAPAPTADTADTAQDVEATSDVAVPDTPGPVINEACLAAPSDPSLCQGVTCEGTDMCIDGACTPQPVAGELVITEILYDPPSIDTGQEWFEVKNVSDHDLTLRGMTVSNDDASETFTVGAFTLVRPGCHAVIAQSGASVVDGQSSTWEGESAFYLQNTRDQIVLSVDGVEIDRVAYDEDAGWPLANGVSLSLDADAELADNADPNLWCFGVDSFEAVAQDGTKTWAKGSAGAANAVCDFDCFAYDCGQRADECVDDGTLKTYSGDGICIPESGCDFSTVTETVDCAAAMGPSFVCLQGACVDPCAGQICSSPPAAECNGNSVVTYGASGVCSAGLCTYPIASTTDCGADVCSTAMGPASCVDASLAGVQLSGYRIQLLQNGEAPEHVKFEVELAGDYGHGSYIVVARNATMPSWPLMFTPALGGADVANVVELYDSEDAWQFNSLDDPVRIMDAAGQVVDMGVGVKNGINRRQADGSWLEVDGATTSGAMGAPDVVAGVGGPLYIFEIGEACGECHLFDYNGNYAMIYIP